MITGRGRRPKLRIPASVKESGIQFVRYLCITKDKMQKHMEACPRCKEKLKDIKGFKGEDYATAGKAEK